MRYENANYNLYHGISEFKLSILNELEVIDKSLENKFDPNQILNAKLL